MGRAEGNLLLPVLWAPRAGDHGLGGAQESSYCRQHTPLWKCEVLATPQSFTPNNFPDPLVFSVVFLEWLMPMVLQCFSYGEEQIKKSLL